MLKFKGEAETLPDSDIQKRLLAAAKILADATAKMVEAARQCASNPHDVNYQDELRRTAEDLRYSAKKICFLMKYFSVQSFRPLNVSTMRLS